MRVTLSSFFLPYRRVVASGDRIAENLLAFLQANVKEGEEAEVAINREMRAVVVFIGGDLALTCSFDDLDGPGLQQN